MLNRMDEYEADRGHSLRKFKGRDVLRMNVEFLLPCTQMYMNSGIYNFSA